MLIPFDVSSQVFGKDRKKTFIYDSNKYIGNNGTDIYS